MAESYLLKATYMADIPSSTTLPSSSTEVVPLPGPAIILSAAGGVTTAASSSSEEMIRRRKTDIPAGLWLKCPNCAEMLHRIVLEDHLLVCQACDYHFRVSGRMRIKQLCDENAFEEFAGDYAPTDPLQFNDSKPYAKRLAELREKTGEPDAVITGKAFIKGRPLILVVMNPDFMIGSMGAVVGEKITLAIEKATEQDLPILIVTCSGGARMQEGMISLQQMAKTSAALGRHSTAGGLAMILLTDPTTGGVSASFAMLGDIILAEPNALVGFAGARVIAGTVRQELPPGFQRAEFLLEHGFIDRIVARSDLRNEIARLIDYCGK